MIGWAASMLVRLYQVTLGKLLPSSCRFTPSCSEYAIQSLRQNGLLRGSAQTIWRLARCQPFARGGRDDVRITGPVFRLPRPRTRMRTQRG